MGVHYSILNCLEGSMRVTGFELRAVLGLGRSDRWPLDEWLASYEEDAFEPEIAIFDAHTHMQDPAIHDKGYPFPKVMLKMLYLLNRQVLVHKLATNLQFATIVNCYGKRLPLIVPYMGPDMLRDIQGNGRGHTVVGTLFVESGWQTPGAEPAMAKVKEADMATDLHKQFPKLCQGIVAAVDLGLGSEVEPALAYYQKNPMVKAIRHGVAFSADPAIFTPPQVTEDLAYDTKFREGLALLKQYGFVYETWNYHEQLEDIADLAKTFPEQTIVCDHLGLPLGLGHWKREEVFPNWQVLMEELAKCPNVFVKIGGLGQRFFGFGFDERLSPPSSDELAMAWQPYVEHCIKVFGVDRCIMESNFPIDKISCSYTVCFNALKKCVRSLSKEEKHKLFELNARRAYGL